MGIVEESFSRLFPGVEFNFVADVSYSGKFKPYNASVRRIGNSLRFSLSSGWKGVGEEITIGLVQHLLVRILRKERFFAAAAKNSRPTLNMQLYDEFIKGVSDVTAVESSDGELKSSFVRVNEKYFLNMAELPNLRWGNGSFRKLASYDYHTNSITVSSLFRNAPAHLLDYLMYHEMLHKKLKFSSSNGRVRHHSAEFRKLERDFDGSSTIESELNSFLRSRRRLARPLIRSRGWRFFFQR